MSNFISNTKFSRVMKFFTLIMPCVLAASFFALPAHSNEEFGRDFGEQTSPANIDEYSRLRSEITVRSSIGSPADLSICDSPFLTCPPEDFVGGNAEAQVECTGGANGGGWTARSVTGRCFERVRVCFGTTCELIEGPQAEARVSSVGFNVNSSCDDSSSDPKHHCTVNFVDEGGVSGATGDDMFSIDSRANVFFEYPAVGDTNSPDRLRWIERDEASVLGETRRIMMPSGPPGDFSDYRRFVNGAAGGVRVEPACYPTVVTLCEDVNDLIPAFDGVCGAADGATNDGVFVNAAQVPEDQLCSVGFVSGLSEDAAQITWQCDGFNGGNPSRECNVLKTQDGVCGLANGNAFASIADISSDQQCLNGAPSTISGPGPWFWECSGVGSRSDTASCAAFPEGGVCDSFFINDNMVFVQDVSGSFGDDIGNIVNALDDLFRNPVFNEWNVGITRFSSRLSGGYQRVNDFLEIESNRGTIIGNTASHRTVIGGSENAFTGIVRAIQDFRSQTPAGETMTLVLVTDEGPSGYTGGSSATQAANAIRDNNVRFIALTNNNNGTRASDFFSVFANQVGGEQIEITANSSNFQSALLNGLVQVNCDGIVIP